MIILPCLEYILFGSYVTRIFLLIFAFSLIFLLIGGRRR